MTWLHILIFLRVASNLQHDDVTSFTCSVHLRSSLNQFPNFLYPINCLIFQGEIKVMHFRHLLGGGNSHLLGLGFGFIQ